MTPTMLKCLTFIDGYIKSHDGISPTYNEIADGMGIKSRSGVHRIVDNLLKEGRLYKMRKGKSARVLAISVGTVRCDKCGNYLGQS